ncbi:MAG: polyketide synthase dehydratase domain-containing protein, partial [Acidobacteriia bacterium]|nr:polyketide synthase dehydratase domain-containing protein [Terriglobia bacterium]
AVYLDRAWPCRAVAMNWGPWDTEGMVSAEVRKQFAQRGVELIPPAIGLRMLEEEILYGRRGEAEVVIGGAGWQPAEKAQTSHSLLPLIAHAPLSRTENGIELIRKINPNFDRYLDDHRLDGQPVLPFAVATELMAEAVAQGWPEMQVTAIQEARLLQGVVLDSETKALRIVAKPKPLNGSAPSHIAVEVTGTTRPRRVHYRATIQLASRLPDAPAITIPPLSDGHAFSMDVPSLYRHWLFHGPSFQGIERIDSLSASGIRAQLATSAPRNWLAGVTAGEWLFDPLMFDSALQLLVVWAREHWDMTALPSGFEQCRLFGRPSSAGVLCELRLRSNTGHQTIHSDIFFLDAATRRVVAIVEDMQGACSKALNRLAGPKVMVATGNLS